HVGDAGGKRTLDHVRQERSAFAGRRRRVACGHLTLLHSLLAFVLLPLLAGLSASAYSIPPDPMWISGVYAAAHYDHVPSPITDSDMTGASARPALARSMRILIGSVTPRTEHISRSAAASALRLRSPPSA